MLYATVVFLYVLDIAFKLLDNNFGFYQPLQI